MRILQFFRLQFALLQNIFHQIICKNYEEICIKVDNIFYKNSIVDIHICIHIYRFIYIYFFCFCSLSFTFVVAFLFFACTFIYKCCLSVFVGLFMLLIHRFLPASSIDYQFCSSNDLRFNFLHRFSIAAAIKHGYFYFINIYV